MSHEESTQIPTSDFEGFKIQLENPNSAMPMICSQKSSILKYNNQQLLGNIGALKKNIVLSIVSDPAGTGHIRNIFPMTYMNSIFGRSEKFRLITTPVPIFDPQLLLQTKVIWMQRFMNPEHLVVLKKYKELQEKYSFKIVWDIDDFIWNNEKINPLEKIPDYNFGGKIVGEVQSKTSIEIMKLVDLVVVSTPFLKKYISETLNIKTPIEILQNAVPLFLWGTERKKPITKKIEIPTIISTASPTHFSNIDSLKGDFEYWTEWIVKNVTDKKIKYYQLGADENPYFFNSIKDSPNYKAYNWINSFSYQNLVKSIRADFSIGPLVPNFFNNAKSNLKFLEASMSGSVFIGAVFSQDKDSQPSPYDDVPVTVPYYDLKILDETVWKLTEPEEYNKILKQQYKILDENGYILESAKYINLLTKILS